MGPGLRVWISDLGTQFRLLSLNVIVPSLKTRFGAPEPLVIWAQLHAAGSNLAACLRAGPKLLGPIAWGTRVGLELGRFVPLPRDFRGWPILALERLNRDFSEL